MIDLLRPASRVHLQDLLVVASSAARMVRWLNAHRNEVVPRRPTFWSESLPTGSSSRMSWLPCATQTSRLRCARARLLAGRRRIHSRAERTRARLRADARRRSARDSL